MNTTVYCENCRIDFDATEWENGICPSCNKKYHWIEDVIKDDDGEVVDSFTVVEWC